MSPTELLSSDAAVAVLDALRERYDYVLVDAPPVLPVSDVAVLAKLVDGVLFLTNDVVSRRGPIRRAVRLLDQVDAPVIGTVVNATPVHQRDSYGDYGFHHRAGYGHHRADLGDDAAPVAANEGMLASGAGTSEAPDR
jgi:receptor protein-tyrosine kinase